MTPVKQLTAAVLALVAAFTAQAQGAGKEPVTIDELRSPTSPAFTILGVAPTNVVRPNSPRDLAVELLSAENSSEGSLPTDFALEVAPYWLVDHPELTFSEYYENKSIGKTILRSLSLSVATSEIPDEGIEGTTLGLGVRFLLFAGKAAPELDQKVSELKSHQLKLLECIPDLDDEEAATPAEAPAAGCSPEEISAMQRELKGAGNAIAALDMQRTGWVVEAALATSRDYPDAEGAESSARQAGAWITASYKVRDPSELTLLVAARLLEDRTGTEKARMKDIGGRFIYESPRLPVSLSLEVMHRSIEDGDSSTSVLGVLEYPINDSLRLVASYGKGLATPTNDSDLQATISVNFGFGMGPTVSLDNLTK